MMPPLMNNHHCYIGSLGNVCRWLAPKAEALGGSRSTRAFAATEVLYDDKGAVRGIATGDMGIAGMASHKVVLHTRGMELLGKVHAVRRRLRGSLTKQLIAKFRSTPRASRRNSASASKEVWQIDPSSTRRA